LFWYRTTANAVDGQLKKASLGYYLSIGFLVISVLVALNILSFFGLVKGLPPLPLITEATPAGTAAIQIFAGLGSRLLVILPALLLARFAGHRHSILFRLREEYNHKYAIASSVHGFKVQAPGFEEPIAAAVFQELLFNPTAAMDSKAIKKENGFLARIIEPQVKAAIERMKLIEKAKGE